MRFYTQAECEEWLKGRNRQRPDHIPNSRNQRIAYPSKPGRIRFLSQWIADSLTHRMPALLWVTEWGIWPSSENWHLYYRLRQSYLDQQLLDEVPGHLFLEHETEDLASFLQLAILNGWGGWVLTEADYVNVFFSHDEFVDFYADRDENLSDLRKVWGSDAPAAK